MPQRFTGLLSRRRNRGCTQMLRTTSWAVCSQSYPRKTAVQLPSGSGTGVQLGRQANQAAVVKPSGEIKAMRHGVSMLSK